MSHHRIFSLGCFLAALNASGICQHHPDDLTSTSIQTDQNGNEIQNYEYSAFGQSRYTQNANVFKVSRRYTSQVLDDAPGLYYYNARYYDPVLARFIQPDDIIPNFADPQSYNRYSYVLNNPLRYTDPSGHFLNSFGDWELNVFHAWFGGGGNSQPAEPDSYQALMERNGTPLLTPLPGPNGKLITTPADAVNVVVKNVAGSLSTAGTMMTPMGEEKTLLSASEKAMQYEKAALAANKTMSMAKLSLSTANKAKVLALERETESCLGIIDKSGNIKLFKFGENGITAHSQLVERGLANKEDLGFSVGLDANGKIAVANMSGLNARLGLGGQLPPKVFEAVKQAFETKRSP